MGRGLRRVERQTVPGGWARYVVVGGERRGRGRKDPVGDPVEGEAEQSRRRDSARDREVEKGPGRRYACVERLDKKEDGGGRRGALVLEEGWVADLASRSLVCCVWSCVERASR
jgi:hypothetical protein